MDLYIETSLQPHISAFINEFYSCVAASASPKNRPLLLGYDFFINNPRGRKHPKDWHLTFLLSEGEKQILADSAMNTLCSYDEIKPLFQSYADPALERHTRNLLLGTYSMDTPPSFPRRQATDAAVQSLCDPLAAKCPSYRIQQKGLYGIVDIFGKVIIPPKYEKIELLAFREWYRNLDCDPSVEAYADLYLCIEDTRQLNSMDVFDMDGHCIFSRIASLYPAEQQLITRPAYTDTGDLPIPSLKEVKTVWVGTQKLERPSPEELDLEMISDDFRKYTVRQLRSAPDSDSLQLHAVQNTTPWKWDPCSFRAEMALSDIDPKLKEILYPMVSVISEGIHRTSVEILQRLPDYRNFIEERAAEEKTDPDITLDSELNLFEMSVRCYNVLRRAGIRTVGHLLNLTDDALMKIRGINPKVAREVDGLKQQAINALKKKK